MGTGANGQGGSGGPLDEFARDQERPALGIRVGQDPQGRVLVSEVRPDSVAAQAGLQVSDEVVRIGDTPIQSSDQVANLVRQSQIGTPFKIDVRRDGQMVSVTGRLGIFASYFGPSDLMQGSNRPALGIRVRANPQGQLEVTQVEPNSPAEAVGMRPGDAIVSADGQRVGNFDELVNALDRAKIGSPIELEVRRNGQTITARPTVTSYAAMFAPTSPGGTERRAARQPLEEEQPGSPPKMGERVAPGAKR
jgi:S1-C subfamily serine protease